MIIYIKDIVSAKLDVKSAFTSGQFYSQTITDAETLQKFEEWFSNAEYMYGGTECGTQYACLELTLANGDVMKLSMATDSCPNFHIDGVAYDYRPVSDWNNSEFYKYFRSNLFYSLSINFSVASAMAERTKLRCVSSEISPARDEIFSNNCVFLSGPGTDSGRITSFIRSSSVSTIPEWIFCRMALNTAPLSMRDKKTCFGRRVRQPQSNTGSAFSTSPV